MKTRHVLLLLPFALIHVSPAHAQWLPDGNALCTALWDQTAPVIVSDGAAGAIVAWYDYRNGTDTNIYVQHIGASGAVLWTAGGVALCTAPGDQVRPTIVTDGAGGAIVAWEDPRPGVDLAGIYARRINAAGVPQWTSDGVALSTGAGVQGEPQSVSDGAGGAFVVWVRTEGPLPSLYGRRVNAAGTPQWTSEIAVCTQVSQAAQIISDGAGGAIVAWEDYRNAFPATDVFAQRVNAAGAILWPADGVALCTASGNQRSIALTTDGASGAIVSWIDPRNGYFNAYARRIDASGTPQWTPDGVMLNTNDAIETDATTIASDGAGGAIVAWLDGGAPYFDIRAQRVNGAGTALWNAEGVLVCNALFDQLAPRMVPDGAGGAIVTWQDQRSSNPTYDDIYAQRLNASGVRQWTPLNGVVVCDANAEQWTPVIASSGDGGAVIAWQDRRTSETTNFDIYANRIGPLGLVPTGVSGTVPTPSLLVGDAYPNPFSNATSLDIALQATSDVDIDIVDVAGRSVRKMMLKNVAGGALRLDLDGRDDRGARLPTGVYFCKVSATGTSVTRKVVIIR